MTDLITVEEAGKLAHKYRFANNDLERVLCETARTVTALHAQLADAQAAQAMVVERAVGVAKRHRSKVQINEPLWHDGQDWASDRIAEAIEALADTDGMALVQALRAERDEAKRLMEMRHREMLAADELMRKHQGRAVAAEADRDALAAANAVLEAKVTALREAVDEQTKARAQHWLRRTMTAPEDAEVEALCERCGYGAVMDAASRLWARKPHGSGAFYIGGCIGFKSDEEARAALAEVQADARREGGE